MTPLVSRRLFAVSCHSASPQRHTHARIGWRWIDDRRRRARALRTSTLSSATTMMASKLHRHLPRRPPSRYEIFQRLFTDEEVTIEDLEDEDHTVCFEYTVAEALKAENVLVRRLTLTGSWPDHLSQRAALALLDAFRHNATIDELILMF
jgi:hypothetical protein